MSDQRSFEWIQLWLGAVLAGVGAIAFLALGNNLLGSSGNQILVAVALLAVIAIGAYLAYRNGRRELAIGLAGGYGLLSLVSAGECTLWIEDAEGAGAVAGFFIYSLLLAVGLIAGAIASAVRRGGNKGGQDQ